MASDNPVLCPSTQVDWEEGRIIGVMAGTVEHPELAYLNSPQAITQELLDLAKPLAPEEVFRFAAPCACSGCAHFASEESKCRLAEKVVRWMPKAVEQLPVCAIRADCRWWLQEGRAACLRCPQMVTNDVNPSDQMRMASNPEVS